MSVKINLLVGKKKRSRRSLRSKQSLVNSGVLFFIFLLIASFGVYAYRLVLAKESDVLGSDIEYQERIIASYKEIEKRKGLLTLKTNEISRIYDSKFDYLKAIEDSQQLFGFSIDIQQIDIEKSGIVSIIARKESEITLSEENAFSTNIKELNLTVIVPTSYELEDTIDTLLGFEGQGLSSVVVVSTQLTDEGEYEVVFSIIFRSNKLDTQSN